MEQSTCRNGPVLCGRSVEIVRQPRDFLMGRPHVDVRRRSLYDRTVARIPQVDGHLRIEPIAFHHLDRTRHRTLGRPHAEIRR